MQAGAERARAGLGWIAAAVVVAVAGIVYLRPSVGPPAPPPRTSALPAAPASPQLTGAAFADADHGVVSVVRAPFGSGGPFGTYETADAGRTWHAAPGGVSYLSDGAGVGESLGGQAAVARFSTDGGRTWRPLRLPEPAGAQQPVFLDARRGWMLVYHGSNPATYQRSVSLWRTDDGGESWKPLAGIGIPPAGDKGRLVFVDATHGALAAGTVGGAQTILFTEDAGQTWHPAVTLTSPLPDSRPVNVAIVRHGPRLVAWLQTLAADQFNPQGGTFLVGSNPHYAARGFALTSDDGGRTWSTPTPGPRLTARFVGQPVLDGRGRLLLLESRRLWVSEDDGATWTARVVQAPEDADPAIVIPSPGRVVLASGSRTAGAGGPRYLGALLRSTDGGVHWDELGLPAGR